MRPRKCLRSRTRARARALALDTESRIASRCSVSSARARRLSCRSCLMSAKNNPIHSLEFPSITPIADNGEARAGSNRPSASVTAVFGAPNCLRVGGSYLLLATSY
jgi:hypothetical protein